MIRTPYSVEHSVTTPDTRYKTPLVDCRATHRDRLIRHSDCKERLTNFLAYLRDSHQKKSEAPVVRERSMSLQKKSNLADYSD